MQLLRKIIIDNTSKDDFCVLAKPEAAKTEAFSYKLRVAMQLFDILSENSEIDHPLCEECTNVLFLQLDSQLRNLKQVCSLSHQVEGFKDRKFLGIPDKRTCVNLSQFANE